MRVSRAHLRYSRRKFVLGAAASPLFGTVDKAPSFPSEWRRFADPTTELQIYRLTDPEHTSRLPAYFERAVAKHGQFLIYSNDRTGSMQAYQMDLKSGQSRQLTNLEALDPASLTLAPDERSVYFLDGPSAVSLNLSTLKSREVYSVSEGRERAPGFAVTENGTALIVDTRAGSSRLISISPKGAVRTVVESPWVISDPIGRPHRNEVLYRQGNEALWLAGIDSRPARKLKLADGSIGPARWSPDGRTVLYLSYPTDSTQLNQIRENTPEQDSDKLVARTSQFVHFGCNGDSSVFVGASRNRAAPYILLLLRVTRRELALCEHRSSDPVAVSPIFSPDSQQVFFHSDRHGKPAIYSVHVERFVEKTESET
jgi:oligogalacturonide lyase